MGNVRYTDKVSKNMRGMIAPVDDANVHSRASVGQEQRVGEYFFIGTDKLMPFGNQARLRFDEKELEELKASIENHGILQPLHISKSRTQEGMFEIISGERRWRASKMLSLERVPCIILKEGQKTNEIAIIENIQRCDLHPLELARAYAELITMKHTQVAVAKSLGISPKVISETLKLLEIPKSLQKELIEKNIRSRDTLRRIVKEKSMPIKGSDKQSVLRISIVQDHLVLQKAGMDRLSELSKKELKSVLVSLVEELDAQIKKRA